MAQGNWGSTGGTTITPLGNVASQAAMLALPARKGDWCIRTDSSQRFDFVGTNPTILSHWTAIPGGLPGTGSVTNTLLASMAAATFKANLTGGSASPSDATADQMQAALAFTKAFTATPSGGTDGLVGFRVDTGVWVQCVAGTWTPIAAPSATGEQLYNGTYPAASFTNQSKFVTTWGVWTIGEWLTSNGTDWIPESRILRLLDPTEPAGTTSASNTLLKTLAFPAGMLRGARRLIVEQEYIAAGTAGTKTLRMYWGASGAGLSGSLVHAPAASATGSVHFNPKVGIVLESNTAQHTNANAVTSSLNHAGGAVRLTQAINVANACEIAVAGSVSAADTLQASYSFVDIIYPSLKT
jgi:hypothetical protein